VDRFDLDHTIPYSEGGATHASNLKCLCRTHHRRKPLKGKPRSWPRFTSLHRVRPSARVRVAVESMTARK
jgi:5-methylcytosine-specific restriction endonuclease McrA